MFFPLIWSSHLVSYVRKGATLYKSATRDIVDLNEVSSQADGGLKILEWARHTGVAYLRPGRQ